MDDPHSTHTHKNKEPEMIVQCQQHLTKDKWIIGDEPKVNKANK